MFRYLMRQATSDITVKSGATGQPIEGRELAKSLNGPPILNLFCERATRRLGGDATLGLSCSTLWPDPRA